MEFSLYNEQVVFYLLSIYIYYMYEFSLINNGKKESCFVHKYDIRFNRKVPESLGYL
jgi:hypothetical protein